MSDRDDKSVDVRVAKALGCECEFKTGLARDENVSAWMCLDGHHRGSRLGSSVRFTGELHHYSSDYAWCGEVQDLNNLTVQGRPEPDSPWTVPCMGTVIKGETMLEAVCEWVIAAIAAGVRVALPGGRIVNG